MNPSNLTAAERDTILAALNREREALGPLTTPELLRKCEQIDQLCERLSAPVAEPSDYVATLRSGLEIARMELWEDTRQVIFDSTVVFSHDYDHFGLQSLRREMRCDDRGYMVWPEASVVNRKWSAYGGPEGAMWFARFDSQDEAMRCVERDIATHSPKHPIVAIRAALDAQPPQAPEPVNAELLAACKRGLMALEDEAESARDDERTVDAQILEIDAKKLRDAITKAESALAAQKPSTSKP